MAKNYYYCANKKIFICREMLKYLSKVILEILRFFSQRNLKKELKIIFLVLIVFLKKSRNEKNDFIFLSIVSK